MQRPSEGGTKVMKHCRQCRADAVGLFGQDRHAEFELAGLPPAKPDAGEARAAHRRSVERRRRLDEAARAEAMARVAALAPDLTARVAVATRGAGLVNEHFGHAREFLVYDADWWGAGLVGHRKVEGYCSAGDGDDDVLEGVLAALSDCRAVLVAKVGRCPRERLASAGIQPVVEHAFLPYRAGPPGLVRVRRGARPTRGHRLVLRAASDQRRHGRASGRPGGFLQPV